MDDKLIPKIPEEKNSIRGFLCCEKFISVNSMFLNKRGHNGRRAHSPEYEKELRELRASLEDTKLVQGCLSEGKKKSLLSVSLVFYLKENLGKRDLDNLIKAVMDSISEYLGFNDNRVISYKTCKRMLTDFPEKEQEMEWVYFEITKSSRTYRDLNIPYSEFKNFMKVNS